MPPRYRARLAERLLESLDHPKQQEIDRLWAEEVEDRIDAYEQGSLSRSVLGRRCFAASNPGKENERL